MSKFTDLEAASLSADKAIDAPSFDMFRAWHQKAMGYSVLERDLPYAFDLYRTLLAAVPASEPALDVFGDRWHSLTCDGTCSPPCKDAPQQYVWQGDPPAPLLHLTKHNGPFYACADVDAAPAPVSGMPDLACLQQYNIDEILRGDRTLKYVKFYKAADVERLLNQTGESK